MDYSLSILIHDQIISLLWVCNLLVSQFNHLTILRCSGHPDIPHGSPGPCGVCIRQEQDVGPEPGHGPRATPHAPLQRDHDPDGRRKAPPRAGLPTAHQRAEVPPADMAYSKASLR